MTDTPSMQDERNRIEADNASLRAQLAAFETHLQAANEVLVEQRAAIASLFDENRVLRGRLALMDEAFMDNHGCFPLDRTNEHEMLWNDACLACREITGDDYQARAVTAVRAREEFLAAALADELFRKVERAQGYFHISDGETFDSKEQFFTRIRGRLEWGEDAVSLMRAFLKKHKQDRGSRP